MWGETAQAEIRLHDSVISPPHGNAITTSVVSPVTLHKGPVETTSKNFLPVPNSQKQLQVSSEALQRVRTPVWEQLLFYAPWRQTGSPAAEAGNVQI